MFAGLSGTEFICMSETFIRFPQQGSRSLSTRCGAAVVRKRDAGNHRSAISHEKDDWRGDLILCRPAAKRHPPEEWVADSWPAPVESGHLRHHHSRVHAVDADIVLAQFKRGNPGDVVQRGL